jgi:ubiquinone/menaquinone biosynthesis C-methylase UbiE
MTEAMDWTASLGRAGYALAQSARVAWYGAHYAVSRRFSGPVDRPGEPAYRPKAPAPETTDVRAAFVELFAKDRRNIEAGLYPAPREFGFKQSLRALDASFRYFRDLPSVDARRLDRRGVEVRAAAPAGRYPAYYLQNFHFQTGGWLTEESAKLYDTQVEILFTGAADAMRRIALGELAKALKGRDQRRAPLIDVACGTGRFLQQIGQAYPRMPLTGLDLSPAYCERAREALRARGHADIVVGDAEKMPFADASFAAMTCVYLFHELPPRVRRAVAAEMARVLAPGGIFVLADAIQTGDAPALDQMLEYFPIGFHEPFFSSYQSEDLQALFGEAGFDLQARETAFLTKVLVFRRT